MSKYVYVVMTEPHEGREDEYNDWYNDRHLEDVLRVPGFTAAQRFIHVRREPGEVPLRRYLALYDIETDNLHETYTALTSKADTDELPLSPAFDKSRTIAHIFEPLTERRTS